MKFSFWNVFLFFVVVFLFAAALGDGFKCRMEINTAQVDIEKVRFITPDTYFPPEVQVKHRNTGDTPIRSIQHTVKYRSPVADTTYWIRQINCRYGDTLRPGESFFSRCDWKGGDIPPTRSSTDRKANASLFFTDVSIIPASDSTGM